MEKTIFKHSWNIDKPQGTVVIIHGLGEHILRYDELAKIFNENGLNVSGFDHFGHGQTNGKKGHIASYEAVYEQIDNFLSGIETNLPIFLYGHSFGGNVVLNYVIDRNPKIRGVIASAPFITMGKPTSKVLLFIGKILSVIYPSLALDNGLDLDNLSTDNQIIVDYKADPLVHDRISARLATLMVKQAKRLYNYEGELAIPLLIMHGEYDILTGPDGSKKFAESISSDVEFKSWENEFHEIHNGKRKQEVWNHVTQWIFSKLN